MNPLRRILATTDLSAPARHAAERAALVSAETAAQLTERLGGEKDYLGRHAITVAEHKELRVRGDGKGGIYIEEFPSYHSLSVEQVARIVEIMREGE